jgi:hypothetical protein
MEELGVMQGGDGTVLIHDVAKQRRREARTPYPKQ